MRRVGALVVVGALLAALGVLGGEVVDPATPAGAAIPPGLSTLSGTGARGRIDGTATTAEFDHMIDMAISPDGEDLYVLELGTSPRVNAIRKVSTEDGSVTTFSIHSKLANAPSAIEVDPHGDVWVSTSPNTLDAELLRFNSSGTPTVMLSLSPSAPGPYRLIGGSFTFDPTGTYMYYEHRRDGAWRTLHRIPLSSLPADAGDGVDLDAPGPIFRDTVMDMAFAADGRLYLIWADSQTSPWRPGLWRADGAGDFTLVSDWHGSEQRIAFSGRRSRAYSTCHEPGCRSIRRRTAWGANAPVAIAGGSSGGFNDADPATDGLMLSPVGLVLSPTAPAAFIADQGNRRVRQLHMPGERGLSTGDGTRGSHGDPVDTATGTFVHAETDLQAPPGSGPADLSRTYASIGPSGGVFGPRWGSNLDSRLIAEPDAATLQLPNGRRVGWEDDAGTWVPLDGQLDVLTETIDGWTLTAPNGTATDFDTDGRMVALREEGEPEITVTWGPASPETMTSASGYEVTFEDWSYEWVEDPMSSDLVLQQDAAPDGTIDRATTSDGRQVDYTYDEAAVTGVLASASRPHAVGQTAGTFGIRTYEPDPDGFALVARIIDQVDGTRTKVVVENTYDDDDRVVEQVTATGDVTTFAHDQAPDGLGGLTPTPGSTTVTDTASGDVTVYEHDANGALIAVTDALGNELTRSWDADRPDVATSRSGVATSYTYDDAGRVTEITATAGPQTRALETITYVTPDTSPAAVTDDRIATLTDETGVTTTYTYAGASPYPETESTPCDPDSTDPSTPCPPSGLATTTYTYHSGAQAGLVASETDADGVVTEHTYDTDRTLATTTTYDGATPLVTTHDTIRAGDPGWSETNPAAVEARTTQAPGGAVTTQVYDAEGRVIETRDALYDGTTHLATTFTYGLDGELVAMTDPAGQVTTHAVARAGDPGWAEASEIAEVRTITRPDGVSQITKIDRSGDVVVEQKGDPGVPAELATTTHTYGPLGRRTSTTDPTGVTTTYEHDEEGRVAAVVDEDGERTETAYDAFGRPTVVTDQMGETTTTSYDTGGRVVNVEDREGHDTTMGYDDAGRVHTVTDARGGVTEQTYTLAGRLAAETDATGRTTRYTYDTAGRRVAAELPSGATTATEHDADGRVLSETSPEGRVRSYTYDDLGRRLTVADPMAGTTTTTYDAAGRVSTETDATGGVVSYTYDGPRVETVTDPLGRVTTYGYDSRGNRTSRTDAKTGVEHWEHDLADRLTAEIDQLGRDTTIAYDDLGRAETITDGANRTETRTYDDAGRLLTSQFGTSGVVTFGYDGEGRRTSISSSVGTTTWSYDEVGNPTAIDEVGTRDLAWTWDLAGRRVELTMPTGGRQRQRYDVDGRPSGVERWDGSAWVASVDLTLDDDGLLVGRDVAGGMDATWDRDPVTGRVDTFTEDLGGTVTSTDLTFDAAGRVETTVDGTGTTTYDYDDAGQLLTADRPGTADDETYVYDELGRRTTSTLGATTTTYAWDAASQLTSRTIGGTAHTYTYDGSGRRTRESWNGGTTYRQWAYTARGELSVSRDVTPSGTDETTRFLRGDGRILSSTTTPAGGTGTTTVYAWDTTQSVPQPVWTRRGTNAVTATYAAGLARLQCTSTTLDCEGPVAHDVLGSAIETADTDDVIAADSYTAFGDPGAPVLGPDFGYRGEIHTGDLVHLRARDYDQESGTFQRPDPLDGVDGTTTVANPYHYADNDPINRVDPTGLRPTDEELIDISDGVLDTFEDILQIILDVINAGLDKVGVTGMCVDLGRIPIAYVTFVGGLCAIDDGNAIGALEYLGGGTGLGLTRGTGAAASLLFGIADSIQDLRGPAVCVSGSILAQVYYAFALGVQAAVCLSTKRSYPLQRLRDPMPKLSDFTGVVTIAGGIAVGGAFGWSASLSLTVTHTWVQEVWNYPGWVSRVCGGRVLGYTGGICASF